MSVIVLSGGGTKGIIHLGALCCLTEKGAFSYESVDGYCGVSIGSAICFLLACGYAPFEIFKEVSKDDFFRTGKKNMNITEWGFMTNEFISHRVMSLLETRLKMPKSPVFGMGKNLTFRELFLRTGKTFTVVVSNINKMCAEYWNHESKPDMSCVEAIRISCNVPVLFTRIVHEGSFYADGGCYDNFPVLYAYRKHLKKKIIAINISSSSGETEIKDFTSYMSRIIMNPLNELINRDIDDLYELDSEEKRCLLIVIKSSTTNFADFSMKLREKKILFEIGHSWVQRTLFS